MSQINQSEAARLYRNRKNRELAHNRFMMNFWRKQYLYYLQRNKQAQRANNNEAKSLCMKHMFRARSQCLVFIKEIEDQLVRRKAAVRRAA